MNFTWAGDGALARRAGGGDKAAFAGLVSRYQARVLAFCYLMLGGRDEAERAAEEIFVETFRALARRPAPALFHVCLYGIAAAHCRGIAAARRARGETLSPEAVMAGLPAGYRAAIALHMQAAGREDTAAALGISIDRLRTLLRRARFVLVRKLDKAS